MTALDADIVILGGGCAGLSLGARLAEAEKAGAPLPRVVIIEPRTTYANDRTWSFWRVRPHDFEEIVEARWWRWRFSAGERKLTAQSSRYCYESIPSLRFYERCLRRIERSSSVSLELGVSADCLDASPSRVRIETSKGNLAARHVVDTRPPRLSTAASGGLIQAFCGVRVVCSSARFDPSTVGLMEDMAVDDAGFRFTYVLPYSDHEALVEATRFSARCLSRSILEADLARALGRAGVETAQIVGREHGAIPMSLSSHPAGPSSVVAAGTRGGAVRPASGYAFLRIDAWARATAKRIAAGHQPEPPRSEPWFRSFMDRVFLATLRREPELAPGVFMALARSNAADRLVRFLSDAGTAVDMANIIMALPARPFLESVVSGFSPRMRSVRVRWDDAFRR